jgi:hypothetical protein
MTSQVDERELEFSSLPSALTLTVMASQVDECELEFPPSPIPRFSLILKNAGSNYYGSRERHFFVKRRDCDEWRFFFLAPATTPARCFAP